MPFVSAVPVANYCARVAWVRPGSEALLAHNPARRSGPASHTREVAGSIPATPIRTRLVAGISLNHAVHVRQACQECAPGADPGAALEKPNASATSACIGSLKGGD